MLGGLLIRYLSGDEVLWGEMIGAYSDPTDRTKQKAWLNSHSVNSKLSPQKTFDCSLVVYDENEITINDCSMWIRNCTVVGLLPLFLLSKEIIVAPTKDCTEEHESLSSDDVVRVIIDQWIYFESTTLDACQMNYLREKLSATILDKVS